MKVVPIESDENGNGFGSMAMSWNRRFTQQEVDHISRLYAESKKV